VRKHARRRVVEGGLAPDGTGATGRRSDMARAGAEDGVGPSGGAPEPAPAARPPVIAVTLYFIRHGESRHNSASKKLDIGLPSSRASVPCVPLVVRTRVLAYARASSLRVRKVVRSACRMQQHSAQCARAHPAVSSGELILQQDHGLSLVGAAQVAGLSARHAQPCVVCSCTLMASTVTPCASCLASVHAACGKTGRFAPYHGRGQGRCRHGIRTRVVRRRYARPQPRGAVPDEPGAVCGRRRGLCPGGAFCFGAGSSRLTGRRRWREG
jgi:hypothetical protein